MVDFAVSDEQEELRRSVRRFFADKSPSAEVRRLMATIEGYDAADPARRIGNSRRSAGQNVLLHAPSPRMLVAT